MATENVETGESTTILLGDCLKRMKEIPTEALIWSFATFPMEW